MLILSITLIVFGLVFFLRDLRKNDLWNNRYMEFPAVLEIYGAGKVEDIEDYSDELLRKLTKDSSIKEAPNAKKVNVSIVVDMEEIKGYDMWTTSKFEDEAVYADCTYLSFYDGSASIIMIPFTEFDIMFNNYIEQKKKYLSFGEVKRLFVK
jgi:hypothetical protein